MSRGWRVETASGPAIRLLEPPRATERTVRFLTAEARAVVLGSTQPESDIDAVRAGAAGIPVTRRSSGGGAVLVEPDQVLWTDVIIPAGDALWTADVGRAFWWVGEVWAAALADAGLPGGQVWKGPLVRSSWSDRICFAGLGAGEVTVGTAKVVGMAQRRTRARAHFQCAVLSEWNPAALLDVMALDDKIRSEAAPALAGVALGVGADVFSRLVPAFVERLP